MKPFETWLLWDAEGTYLPSLHPTRKDAREEQARHSYLIDAKWRVVKVWIRKLP